MLKTISTATARTTSKTTNISIFPTSEAKLASLQLRHAFTKAAILQHFDPEQYIEITTDVSDYAISNIFSQLTPESRQWHSLTLFSRKMILIETQYKTQN